MFLIIKGKQIFYKITNMHFIAFVLLTFSYAFAFSKGHDTVPTITPQTSEPVIIQGCIGDCASCHTLTKEEAKRLLSKKFDVKEILKIVVDRGFFKVEYLDSKNRKQLINIMFGKNKAAKEIFFLDDE